MSRVISPAMTVGEIATRKPICVDPDMTILGASNLMRSYRVSDLVVTKDTQGLLVPVGIVLACDIVTRIMATGLDPAVFTAGDITWSGSVGAKVTDSVSQALQSAQATA